MWRKENISYTIKSVLFIGGVDRLLRKASNQNNVWRGYKKNLSIECIDLSVTKKYPEGGNLIFTY